MLAAFREISVSSIDDILLIYRVKFTLSVTPIYLHFRESVKSGHHCCPCQAPPPPVLVTTSPSARIIRQSSQPEASACCCSGCCCPLHTGTTPSAASLRQLREPGDGIAGIAADSLRINGGIRQFRQVSTPTSSLRIKQKGSAVHPPAIIHLLARRRALAHTTQMCSHIGRLLGLLDTRTPFTFVYVYHAFASREGKPGCPFLLEIVLKQKVLLSGFSLGSGESGL